MDDIFSALSVGIKFDKRKFAKDISRFENVNDKASFGLKGTGLYSHVHRSTELPLYMHSSCTL